eukprot:2706903-Pyramimonas_sp.AAC.1
MWRSPLMLFVAWGVLLTSSGTTVGSGDGRKGSLRKRVSAVASASAQDGDSCAASPDRFEGARLPRR